MNRPVLLGILFAGLAFAAHARDGVVSGIKTSEVVQSRMQRDLLIGTWEGEASVKGGGSRSWTIRRSADGTFRVDFTMIDAAGRSTTQSEVGIWGTSAGIYFTATRGFMEDGKFEQADTTDPALYDVYKIVELTSDRFEYENPSTGNRFVVRRQTSAK